MKCPYRVVRKTTYKNCKDNTVEETFMDCYEKECPFFYIAKDAKGNDQKKCKKDK